MAERPAGTFGLPPEGRIEVLRIGEGRVLQQVGPAQPERQVGNGQAHLQEHRLVERLHFEHIQQVPFQLIPSLDPLVVDVRPESEDGQEIGPDDRPGILVEEAGIGLEVDDAVRDQEMAVTLEEKRRRQAGVLAAAELWRR